MPALQHPNVPWIVCEQSAPGVFRCACQVCHASMQSPGSGQAADQFARVHSAHQNPAPQPTHYGAGDLVAKATGALGIKPCAPCDKRRQQLNGLFPNVWRR
jgi:hypothetical protein